MVGESLPHNWSWSTLGEVADPRGRAIVSGPFGSNIGSKFFVETGVPVIRGNNLTTDLRRFIDQGFVFVTEAKADELGNCEAVADDLIFTAAGSLGQVGLIPKIATYRRYIISNKQLRARLDRSTVDPLFAFYWFSSKEMVAYIQQRNTGSSVPLINLGVLRSLPIPVPPLAEQSGIARVLDALDEKIGLNRRANETLEAIARALFKSWFVDFDPVCAKAEARDAGLPKDIADLFPESFEKSVAGEIPKGWRIGTMRECCDRVENGGTPRRSVAEYWEPKEIPWLTSGEVRQKVVIDTENRVSRKGLENSSAKLWPKETTVVALYGATAGQVTLAVKSLSANQACCAFIARPNWRHYVYLHASSSIQALEQQARGSAQQNLSQQLVADLPTVICGDPVCKAFDDRVAPFFQKWFSNLYESQTLAAVRDALLPKLFSGEVRMKDAERIAVDSGV